MNADKPFNTIVFAPISLREGMAGAKRLGNLAEYLKADHRIINLYRSNTPGTINKEGIEFRAYRAVPSEIMHLVQIRKGESVRNPVYYHYGYPSYKNICNLLIAWLLGYKILIDIVEDYHAIASVKKGYIKKYALYFSLWLLRRSSPFVTGYIVISNHLWSMLNTMFRQKKHILLLPISIDSHHYNMPVEGHSGKLIFFYGGSFAPKDDFDVMLRSFINVYEQYPGKIDRLYLSGRCSPEKQLEILAVAGAKKAAAIHFLGYLDDAKYYRFIRNASVLVMPRNNSDFANTGFPFKLGEYMATGNCVVSARLPSVVEMIGEQALIYYTPESVESMTQAFDFVITQPETCRRFALKARSIAFEKFDARNHVRKLNEFIMNA